MRRHLQPTTDSSETATIVVPVEHASTRAMVYPNSKPVDQLIIIENNNRHFPVMSSDATEVRDSLERGVHDATATTGVAGAEQMTRTGHRYNQISSSYVEPFVALEGETSQEEGGRFGFTVAPSTAAEAHACEGSGMLLEAWTTTEQEKQHLGQSEQSSVGRTLFTKLAVKNKENGARSRADTSIGDRDEVSTEVEFPRSLSRPPKTSTELEGVATL